jgi:O-antigen ligase
MVAALALGPVLLFAQVANSPQLRVVASKPVFVAAVGLGVCVCVVLLAALFRRWPTLFVLACLVTLPIRLPLEVGGHTANLLLPLYVVIGAGAFLYAYERFKGESPRFAQCERGVGWLELCLVLAVVLYAAQAVYSSDYAQAFANVVFFYLPFALLFKLISEIRWSRRLVIQSVVLLASLAVLFALVGFWEYAAHKLLLNPRLVESNQFEPYFRINSLFFDPNVYGRFLALVMLAIAPVLLWRTRMRELAVGSLVLGVLWAALVLTFSRSSFWALLVGLAVLAALRFGPLKVGGAVAVFACGGVAAVLAFPTAVGVPNSLDAINHASSGRLKLVTSGIQMFDDRPLGGYGPASFSNQFRALNGPGSERAASISHTTPVTVAAEQGILGLLLYVLVLVFACKALLTGLGALRQRGPPLVLIGRAAIAAGFAALVLHTFLYADYLEDPFTWALLGITLALGGQAQLMEEEPEPVREERARVRAQGRALRSSQ